MTGPNGQTPSNAPEPSLRYHADFRRLWIAQTVSRLGSTVSQLALPLAAILVVHASTLAVGLLVAAENAAFLLIGLPSGALVDRVRTRPVLIGTDLARAVALGSVPLAAAFGVLGMAQLYAVSLFAGVCTVFFDVGSQTYLPELVDRPRLVEGNAKLQASESLAQIAGPTVGGFLIQLITAPYAILLDALSYVWSAAWLGRIQTPSVRPQQSRADRNLGREIVDGVRFVLGDRTLRSIVLCTATLNLFHMIGSAVYVLLLARTLHLSPGAIGLVGAVAAFGALGASLFAQRLSQLLGPGPTICLAAFMAGPPSFVLPFVHRDWTLLLLTVAQGVFAASVVTYNITQVSLRQALCPPALLGRMNATVRFVVWGVLPIGAAIGSVLGSWIGLRPALFISAVGVSLAFLTVVFSPVRTAGQPAQPVGSL